MAIFSMKVILNYIKLLNLVYWKWACVLEGSKATLKGPLEGIVESICYVLFQGRKLKLEYRKW
jgi:hypothetical protein